MNIKYLYLDRILSQFDDKRCFLSETESKPWN